MVAKLVWRHKGLYISQTALKKVETYQQELSDTTPKNVQKATDDMLAPCGCSTRSSCQPVPNTLLLSATPEYREKLENWIKCYFTNSAFNTYTHQKLQTITDEPLSISFGDKCSRMITIPENDGSPRRTIDLQNLNASTRRETHHTPSSFNLVSTVPPGKKKTVLDAYNGYHSVPLSGDACDATKFITEWNRYRYLRATQGFQASNDGYTKRVACCVDDSILWDDDVALLFWHTVKYIRLRADNWTVFNPDKFHFGKNNVEFAGSVSDG